ncbi:aspartate ammonia-lyase [Feifania hominis]|uniref:Aspartate ammonia-lyase n=1 Tax=Feifania hominis TaxID=2763660 RepID=A0A926DGH0_9FIRM|nr:aspartate ammonia-lyase [Feifania hominis]MBC8536864.1 aspartate ammonia-lyase [Feifania hominis]
MTMRIERDSIGEMRVDQNAYYGIQTLRAAENFPITGRALHPEFIRSLAAIKRAAAITNYSAGLLTTRQCTAICAACDEILAGELREWFITDPIQGGAGTSANMNANEVICNRAIELLGGARGDYAVLHPNDHINMGQSTNDVIPTAGRVTAIVLLGRLIGSLASLCRALADKELEFDDIVKVGRTQLQDAVPIRLGQEFGAWRCAIERDMARLRAVSDELAVVNMGGTAIGTSLNASSFYVSHIVGSLAELTGLPLRQASNLIDATQNLDAFVAASAAVKNCAVNLSKMCNDLRLLSSGPRTGIGEITLPARQNGSSIMPGKVNPVIPEVVSQIAFGVIGNDCAITLAAEAGQLELNAFEPILFYKLFESIETLANGVASLDHNCLRGVTANRERCGALLEGSVSVVTVLCPRLGYQKSAAIAKEALRTGRPVRALLLEQTPLTAEEIDRLLDPRGMTMGHAG